MSIYEQYPDARQYLESVRTARAEARRCSARAHELRLQCESITAPLRELSVSNGNKDPHGDSAMIALDDMLDKLETKSRQWLRRMDEVDEFIDRIESVEYRIILRLRYVDCQRWAEVHRSMHKFGMYYEEAQMYRLHGRALNEARQIWNEERRVYEDCNREKEDQ